MTSRSAQPSPTEDVVTIDGYRVSMEWGASGSKGPSVELRRQVYCQECDVWHDFSFSPHPDHEAP